MESQFKDGICVITKKQSVGCLSAPAGTILPGREILFSEEGINLLDQMYGDANEYFNETCVINQKKYKRCLKLFNVIFLKRNAFISQQGIDNLSKAMASKPDDETITEEQAEELISDLDDEEDVEIEDVLEEEPQSEVPGVDEELNALVSAREEAEVEVAELQENLDKAADEEVSEKIKPLLKEAQEKLMAAEAAERDYVNKE